MNSLSAPSSRINARLDEQAMLHLASLKAALGLPVSDILRASLAMYDAAMTKKKPAPRSAFKNAIGKYRCDDPMLSVNYKSYLAQGWEEKYAPKTPAASKSTKL
jgi:hypothetical protein